MIRQEWIVMINAKQVIILGVLDLVSILLVQHFGEVVNPIASRQLHLSQISRIYSMNLKVSFQWEVKVQVPLVMQAQ